LNGEFKLLIADMKEAIEAWEASNREYAAHKLVIPGEVVARRAKATYAIAKAARKIVEFNERPEDED
jgi:hypothetical protein